MQVKIATFEVGQKFGCAARVVALNNRVVHRTRDYPYGMDGNAYQAARRWVEDHGHRIVDERDDH